MYNKNNILFFYAILYFAFLYIPVMLLPVFSFNDAIHMVFPLKGFTLKWYDQMIHSSSLSEIKEEISSMEDIFNLQEMYDIKNKEKKLEEELKKLGYIN